VCYVLSDVGCVRLEYQILLFVVVCCVQLYVDMSCCLLCVV